MIFSLSRFRSFTASKSAFPLIFKLIIGDEILLNVRFEKITLSFKYPPVFTCPTRLVGLFEKSHSFFAAS